MYDEFGNVRSKSERAIEGHVIKIVKNFKIIQYTTNTEGYVYMILKLDDEIPDLFTSVEKVYTALFDKL